MTKIRQSFNLLAAVILLGVIASCAIAPAKMVPLIYSNQSGTDSWPDTELQKRFGEYWYNRFTGQVEVGYQMESPDFIEMVELNRYKNFFQHAKRNKLQKIEITDIKKETEHLVNVYCKLLIQGGDGDVSEISLLDQWVYVSNQWYHILKDPIFFKLS